MAKKIDMLRSGLPSKMYYLGYKQPMSIYEMSKKIYGKPQPQKMYIWKERLKDKGYFIEVNDKWQSTVTPLIEEIKVRLAKKGIRELSKDQLDFLTKFLDNQFRKVVMLYESDINKVTDALEFLLTDLELYLIIYENAIFRRHPDLKTKFRTMKDYNQWVKNIPKLKQQIQKAVFNMTRSHYGKGLLIDIEMLSNLFIPYELIELLRGVSVVGEKYLVFTQYVNETVDLTSKVMIK